jgi:hypothetical protein
MRSPFKLKKKDRKRLKEQAAKTASLAIKLQESYPGTGIGTTLERLAESETKRAAAKRRKKSSV